MVLLPRLRWVWMFLCGCTVRASVPIKPPFLKVRGTLDKSLHCKSLFAVSITRSSHQQLLIRCNKASTLEEVQHQDRTDCLSHVQSPSVDGLHLLMHVSLWSQWHMWWVLVLLSCMCILTEEVDGWYNFVFWCSLVTNISKLFELCASLTANTEREKKGDLGLDTQQRNGDYFQAVINNEDLLRSHEITGTSTWTLMDIKDLSRHPLTPRNIWGNKTSRIISHYQITRHLHEASAWRNKSLHPS